MISFFVAGTPAPKGSWNSYGPGRFVPQNAKSANAWEKAVKIVAKAQMMVQDHAKYETAVAVQMVFYMPKPKYVKAMETRVRNPMPTPRHVKKPDLDKLVRGVLDPLTGIVYNDDSQVDQIQASKAYEGDLGSGCAIVVGPSDC